MKLINFSIVTAIYNRISSGYLGSFINAVRNQKKGPYTYEHIVVDDGSSDNTEEYIKKQMENDSNLKYVKQENKGPIKATKKGIEKNYCSVCGNYGIFLDFGDPVRLRVGCPICGSLERHRFLYYIYQLFFLNNKRVIDLLHMAPEKCLFDKLSNNENINYTSADLNPAGYAFANCLKENFLNMSFNDKTFDVILTNHVLEHIVEEKKYLLEMKRCLKDDGCIILSIPYNINLDKTFEDSNIKTLYERKKAFGQDDHVRIYGSDVYKRLGMVGFSVNQIYTEIFPKEFIDKNRLEKSKNTKKLSGGYFILKKKL